MDALAQFRVGDGFAPPEYGGLSGVGSGNKIELGNDRLFSQVVEPTHGACGSRATAFADGGDGRACPALAPNKRSGLSRGARLRGRSFTPFYGASFVAAKARRTSLRAVDRLAARWQIAGVRRVG